MNSRKHQAEAIGTQISRLGLKDLAPPAPPPLSRWGQVIGAILQFQKNHNNQSPTNHGLAVATGLSVGQVQNHLHELEEAGFVHDRPGWPRRLVVTASAIVASQAEWLRQQTEQPQEEEETMAQEQPVTNGKKKGREPFMVMAKRYAEALTDYQAKHGTAPLLGEMAFILGYSTGTSDSFRKGTGGLSRVTSEMVERGWLHHKRKHQRDFALTDLGRAVLLGEPMRVNVAEPEPQPDPEPQPEETTPTRDPRWDPEDWGRIMPKQEAPPVATVSDMDAEIEAMRTVLEAIEPLDKYARHRTLNWVRDRLSM